MQFYTENDVFLLTYFLWIEVFVRILPENTMFL